MNQGLEPEPTRVMTNKDITNAIMILSHHSEL